jgi:CHAD domain-containing protein
MVRRLRALGETLPGALDGESAAIHKARVASRRVREALPIVLAQAPPKQVRKIRRTVQRITRALGPLRELDVTLGLIATEADARPDAAGALDVLRQQVLEERHRREAHLLERLQAIDIEKLAYRVTAALEPDPHDAPDGNPAVVARAVLAVRVARRARELHAAVDAAGSLYAPEPLHDVRIAVKKLRYALELAADLRLLASSGAVSRLKAAQNTLGALHDLQVLAKRIEAAQADLPAEEADTHARLTEALDDVDRRCRELHAAYIGGRDRLLREVNEAVEHLTSLPASTMESEPATPSVH